ncbi:MAG: ribosome small subunit-dependent GTPase A [Bacilli bacterium]|nr:ribosome small subunit-dependent GTPase A [Bacilli bacterium]MBP3635316.1 ribosome small subunit-dependent GTPase A [Bacilli bacterium]
MRGKIIKVLSNDYTVRLINEKSMLCKARGVFRNKNIIPLAGDNVLVDINRQVITDILPRKNELVRPPVANIDLALIVVSAKEPDFSSNLLDKMINIIEYNNITPVIIISKYDLLLDTTYIDSIITYYKKIGYKVLINSDIVQIRKIFREKVTILTGQTGVGKSTLINKLEGSMNLDTDVISKSLGRGKHTTRHIELYDLFCGFVADTPGFSSLSFIDMKKEDIRDNFIEFNEYKDKCKYRDCMHINEDECEIKRKLENGEILKSRYENYIKFINEKEREK